MNIAVYCASSMGNKEIYAKKAKELGEWIGREKHTLVYGGSNSGLMGVIADAVLEAGGEVIGVVPDVPLIQARKHPGLTKLIETGSMAERKSKMIELADAYVAMPGGLGTFDEITEILSLQSLKIIDAPILFYNVDHYYDPMKVVIDGILANEFGQKAFFEKVLFSCETEELDGFLK